MDVAVRCVKAWDSQTAEQQIHQWYQHQWTAARLQRAVLQTAPLQHRSYAELLARGAASYAARSSPSLCADASGCCRKSHGAQRLMR